MKKETLYDGYLKDKEFARIMAQEDLIMDVTENFCKILEDEGIKRTKLAQLMGKTRGYISQRLNGHKNITLRSLSDIAFVLGYQVNIIFKRKIAKNEQMTFGWDTDHKKSFPQDKVSLADDYLYSGFKLARLGS